MPAEPFQVSITEAEIADLRERLRRTRWPEREPVDDWSQGLPLAYAQELCRSWAEDYDFGFADRLNVFPQYRDTIDGLGIHFLHVRSPEPGVPARAHARVAGVGARVPGGPRPTDRPARARR
jgi:hypothetical protein